MEAAETVVPLFVVDPAVVPGDYGRPNRLRFLHDALADLRDALRRRGADLVVRRGDPATQTARIVREVNAGAVFATADVTRFARHRERRLANAAGEAGAALQLCPGVAVVDPGAVRPTGSGDHFKVFTPYSRAWAKAPRRRPLAAPRHARLPSGVDPGALPTLVPPHGDQGSADLVAGGETAGRRALDRWMTTDLEHYDDIHDDLAADQTSRLATLPPEHIHRPWLLGAGDRPAGYPEPVVDHDEAQAAFHARRRAGAPDHAAPKPEAQGKLDL